MIICIPSLESLLVVVLGTIRNNCVIISAKAFVFNVDYLRIYFISIYTLCVLTNFIHLDVFYGIYISDEIITIQYN